MTVAFLEHRRAAAIAAPRTWFFAALAAATFLPLVLVPLLLPRQNGQPAGLSVFALLTFGHVGATLYLYADREFRPLLRPHRALFVAVPVLAAIAMCLAAGAWPKAAPVMLLLSYCWTLHHFGRQNFGIVNFALKGAGLKPMRRAGDAIALLAAAGVLGVIASRTQAGLPRSTGRKFPPKRGGS